MEKHVNLLYVGRQWRRTLRMDKKIYSTWVRNSAKQKQKIFLRLVHIYI